MVFIIITESQILYDTGGNVLAHQVNADSKQSNLVHLYSPTAIQIHFSQKPIQLPFQCLDQFCFHQAVNYRLRPNPKQEKNISHTPSYCLQANKSMPTMDHPLTIILCYSTFASPLRNLLPQLTQQFSQGTASEIWCVVEKFSHL